MFTVKTKLQCDKCSYWFSAKGNNYKKHINVCDGNYIPSGKRNSCKFCELIFDNLNASQRANHTRWCKNNPKKYEYIRNTSDMRKGITSESIKKMARSISNAHKEGKFKHCYHSFFLGKKHTDETKQILREKALASSHRRLKKGTILYNGILLDSSWELELAKRLDEQNIKWIRPNPIPWADENGVNHNYFPDFYLVDYDLYLDPKNPQAIKVQQKKLNQILIQYKNIIILDSLEKCKQYSI